MKVIFFGSSQYCLSVLESLHKNFDLKLVGTHPDKPVGRKQILTPSATKVWAQENNIPTATPATLKRDAPDRKSLMNQFIKLNPDLAVVADYGLIIPEEIFSLPKLGTINIHFSKLPDLRGPSPVQFTLLRDDQTAWITIFKIDEGLDTGPILWQREYPIKSNDTTETLYTRLFQEVAKVLPTIINDYGVGKIKLTPQDHSRATYTKFLTRDDGFVKWEDLGKPVTYNIFRAMTPWPGLWTLRQAQGKLQRMKVLKCHLEENKLVLDQVQFEGKKSTTMPPPL